MTPVDRFYTHGPARGLDHVVIGCRDLAAAAAFYATLGFTVGARNQHPWGTENHIVQFDGSFLELLGVGDASLIPDHGPHHFSFGAFMREAIGRGEGLAMLALESRDALADAAQFKAAGLGDFEPFHFERKARTPDGTQRHVAFSLAFARDARAPDCGFFTCQHHVPENFWNPAFQTHANGASGIASAIMTAENPTDHHMMLEAFTGQRSLQATSLGLGAVLPRGRFDVLTPRAAAQMLGEPALARQPQPRFAGLCLSVPKLDAMAARLEAARVPHQRIMQRLVVPALAAHGLALAFEQTVI